MKEFSHNSKKSVMLIFFSCFLMAAIIGIYALVYRPADSREKRSVKEEKQIAYEDSDTVNEAETDGTPLLKARCTVCFHMPFHSTFFSVALFLV